ncbi:MAG: hypothetical protein ACQEWM_12240 [Actinomycetota bacterium]
MYLAATPVDSTGVDPVAVAVVSGLGGVALTALVALLGAWLQSRREHKRWIRERRLDAFIALMKNLHQLRDIASEAAEIEAARARLQLGKPSGGATGATEAHEHQVAAVEARSARLDERVNAGVESLVDALTPLAVLGPRNVQDAAGDVAEALARRDQTAADKAQEKLDVQVAKALGIKD